MKKLFLLVALVLMLSVSISSVFAGSNGDGSGNPGSIDPGCTLAWPQWSWNINQMLSDIFEGCVPIIRLGIEG
ncbi:MAG: hypothetical protein AABY10_04430 [Nanoarchaeota archaeon]